MFHGSVPILMYHRVSHDGLSAARESSDILGGMTIPVDRFARQMKWLASRGYGTVSLDDLYQARAHNRSLPRRSVIITFDDGYQDVADNAVPVLEQHGFTAHIFVIPGLIGRNSEWDLDENGWAFPLFDWNTVRSLEERGFHCDAHTMTHPYLTTLDVERRRQEISESRYVLKQELGREIRHFAYPFGDYDEETRALVCDAGFDTACSVRRSLSSLRDDRFALHRLCIHWDDELFDFQCNVLTGVPIRSGVRRRLARLTKRDVYTG